jgi:hypothetical protein
LKKSEWQLNSVSNWFVSSRPQVQGARRKQRLVSMQQLRIDGRRKRREGKKNYGEARLRCSSAAVDAGWDCSTLVLNIGSTYSKIKGVDEQRQPHTFHSSPPVPHYSFFFF